MEIKLTTNDILDKDFKISMRGYNQDEVDQYLDTIIQDYQAFQNEINQLKKENEQLKRRLQSQSTENRPKAAIPNHQVNYDVLKRLSNLEKAVFGNKYSAVNNNS